jgi:hypothetical protein
MTTAWMLVAIVVATVVADRVFHGFHRRAEHVGREARPESTARHAPSAAPVDSTS